MHETENIEQFDLESIERGYDVKSTWRLGNEADKKLKVRFFNKSTLQRKATIEAKRPIYKPAEYVEIQIDSKSTLRRPVTEEDKARFAEQYKLFQQNAQVDTAGTPIDYVRSLSVDARATCKSVGINKVEDLIEVDAQKKMLLGDKADTWIEQAKKYLSGEEADPAVVDLLKKENDENKKVLQLQNKQIADLQKLLSKEEKKKGKNGKDSSSAPTGDS